MLHLEWDTGTLHCKLFSIFKYSNMQYAFTEKHFRSYIVLHYCHMINIVVTHNTEVLIQ